MSERPSAPTEASERLPLSYLGASYLAHAVTTIGTVVAITVFLLNPDIWPGQWAIAVFGAIFLFRMIDPIYEWGTTRIRLSADELTVTNGLINRRTRSIPWHAVRTVESTAPWAHRLFSLVRVRIAQGGDLSTQVTLAGITRELRDTILEYSPVPDTGAVEPEADADNDRPEREFSAQNAAAALNTPAASRTVRDEATRRPAIATGTSDTVLYRATLLDLVVASILFGRFALIGVAIAFALYEQLERFGLLGILTFFQGGGAIGFAVFVALVIIGIGITASVVRYARLEVRRVSDGAIIVTYGLVETHERVIDTAAITGVVLQRNILEMLLGRVRLALLTTDTSQQFGANLLLPSLPRATVARILAAGFGDRVPESNLATRRRLPLLPALVFAVVTALASALGWWLHSTGVALGLAIVAGLIGWAVLVVFARPLVTRLDYDTSRGTVALRALFIVDRETYLDALAIHLVNSTVFGGRTRYVTVHYYAGEARQRGSVWFSEQEIDALQNRLGDREQRAERIRRARENAAARREALSEIDALVGAKE
ncbi:PH domain-containing protein [Microbacterium sp. LTA6]|uniref:PH domain-containing protein n=1 Tax=Microbacterium sp. LTA6 TaxID=3129771 RepID=UPI00324F518C